MALPLPSVLSNVGPGGRFFTDYNAVTQANLENQKNALANQFSPLSEAIKAQNALSYGSRMGNLNQFFKAFAEMPVAERQAYLADQKQRAQYMDMIRQFQSGINNPQMNNNVLTPDFLKQFNFSGGQQPGFGGILGAIMNAIGNKQPQPANALLDQGAPQTPANAIYNPPAMPEQQSVPVAPISNKQAIDTANKAAGTPPQGNAANQPMATISDDPYQNGYTDPKQSDVIFPQPIRNQDERGAYASQMMSNNQAIGKVQAARADGADTFDKFVIDNRPLITKQINDAFHYQGIYGRGKNWLDKLKHNQPQAYANYKAASAIIENLANQIKFMEHMASSNEQRESAREMVTALDQLDQSPETAARILNTNMRTLMQLSKTIRSVAEPRYPGARARLFNIGDLKGDYINSNILNQPASGSVELTELPAEALKGPKEFNAWMSSQPSDVQQQALAIIQKKHGKSK